MRLPIGGLRVSGDGREAILATNSAVKKRKPDMSVFVAWAESGRRTKLSVKATSHSSAEGVASGAKASISALGPKRAASLFHIFMMPLLGIVNDTCVLL